MLRGLRRARYPRRRSVPSRVSTSLPTSDSSTPDSVMTPLFAMVRANLKMSLRNRAALFWNLAFPALFIVIFGVVFGRGTTVEFDVGVAGPESAFRDAVVAALQANPSFVVSIGDEAEELQALADGNRGVVAVFASEADRERRGPAGGDPLLQRDGGAGLAGGGRGGAPDVDRRGGWSASAADRGTAGHGARRLVHGHLRARYPGHEPDELRGDRAGDRVRHLPRARHPAPHPGDPVPAHLVHPGAGDLAAAGGGDCRR